ncbi:cation diffusion facilitator family transporter [Streptomyces sp. WAC 00631]|uniref:cation diffusion facilitator family transporter n=1 Tax=unclassified Streptomyces TaxID=2593676 RepID=UPI000F78FC8D|nr:MULTISPECIES: cation diffusion facilitator family transporter [unclassified Streptomyces]MCC5033746.1 cation diffusion facilitator family transporter [Streptomyces sp. WAC 00631]MCC9742865.1 cation diffusion facilitator family transporter [Streptomyces sp. MNU89]
MSTHRDKRRKLADKRRREDKRTRMTVLVALAANLVIALAKALGGLFAGSPALLSEAAHSVADSMNEVFLLASLRRSRKKPDAEHPFGYGKERFFWSLLAAVGIFVMGGCFSFYQGVSAMGSGSSESLDGYVAGLVVLGIALLAEGTSLLKAVHQLRGHARRNQRGMIGQLRAGTDPALRTVLAEDGTACLGVLLAAAGMGLHMATGDILYEAWASMLIGVLLVYVAYRLGRENRDQLIGVALDPALRQEIHTFLDEQPEIDTVTVLLTMRLGMDSTLVAGRVDLIGGLDSEEVEEVSERIKNAMESAWPLVDQIFLDITEATAEDRRRARRERRELDATVAAVAENSG